MTTTKHVLAVADLGQSFGDVKALEGVGFTLDSSERLAVLGPSGSGKTTLLRLIAGLEAPTTGTIAISGIEVSRAHEVLIAPERREVALVFQGLALFPHLNALEQIAFASRGRGGSDRARELLEHIGLGHRAKARLDQLSGGERQRIALARALAQQPKLLLMDEPFASLDDEKRAEMRDLLRALLESSQTTLMLVTHSREDALNLAQRVLVLEKGRQIVSDRLESTVLQPRHTAAVRALGLGQVVEGKIVIPGVVATCFGNVKAAPTVPSGTVRLLVRPGQPRLCNNDEGTEAEVISVEFRPSDGREVRRIVVVRTNGKCLRVLHQETELAVGTRVRVRIEGECEFVND
jgi:ABC-type Fe3+/spermidine/putrescine transport system ATPase subunit